MDSQFEAYTYYPEDTTDDHQRASGSPHPGQSMSRGLSNYSNSSGGTSSSASDYSEDLSPLALDSAVDMSTDSYYRDLESDPYYGEYNTYYDNTGGTVPPYYESAQSDNYTMSPDAETMGTPFEDTIPRSSAMQAPVSASEVPNGSHLCLVRGCESQHMFKRKADLQRHYDQIHRPTEQKKRYYCDYPKCERHQSPFHRMDHFRDHYRDFHTEDLCRKQGESPDWYLLKQKTVRSRWWRCVKCLLRVTIKDHGWQCICGQTCDVQRRQIRGYE